MLNMVCQQFQHPGEEVNHNTLLIQKTYQLINVVNGVSRSYKTANIFFIKVISYFRER